MYARTLPILAAALVAAAVGAAPAAAQTPTDHPAPGALPGACADQSAPASTCTRLTWLPVRGASRWSFRLPKRLPAGAYRIRTRAFDFAGNVERPHGRRVKLAKRRRGKR